MGSNPMQKMKRNSILTGLVIGLVIGLILCAIVYIVLTKNPGALSLNKGETITVCVLNKTVKSGTKVTAADIITKNINKDSAPTDATTQVIDGVAKIDLTAGTILGSNMLSYSAEKLTADLREQEYNMISLPTQLTTNDFVDIRLQLPNGGDYIVVSKKQVLKCNSTSIWLEMKEEETLKMSNAIIEYYIMAGSKLYATKYTEPGSQEASVPTYCPNADVATLVSNYKNETINKMFSETIIKMRNDNINPAIRQYDENKLENIEKNIQEEIDNIRKSREAYFGALNAVN